MHVQSFPVPVFLSPFSFPRFPFPFPPLYLALSITFACLALSLAFKQAATPVTEIYADHGS